MVDFSKLMAKSPEERERDRAEMDRRFLEKDLSERAGAATDMRRLVLTEDPEVRYGRDGLPYALLRSEREGSPYSVVAKPVFGEDDRAFCRRMDRLDKGDEIVAHGHEEERRWKDQNNNWRSTKEFQADVPLSPESFRNELPEGVSFPPSAFSRKQRPGLDQGIDR